MGRVVVGLAIGLALGAMGGYWLADPSGTTTVRESALDPTHNVPSYAVDINANQPAAEQLPTVIRENADASPYELNRLLGRYADEDPAGAIELAEELGLTGVGVAPLYARWARLDMASALRAWGRVEDPRTAAAIATEMMPALGGGPGALRLLVNARPPNLDESRLVIEIVGATADRDVQGARALLEAIDDRGTRGIAERQIAKSWGQSDPQTALAHAENIENVMQRNRFKADVYKAWGTWQPRAVLDHLSGESIDGRTLWMTGLGAVVQEIAAIDPVATLEFADSQSGQNRAMLQSVALTNLAQRDIGAALAYIESSGGSSQKKLYQAVATQFGRSDPSAAIAWAEEVGDPEVLSSVLASLPDTAMALNEMVSRGLGFNRGGVHRLATRAAMGPDPGAFGSQLLAVKDDSMKQQGIAALVQMWGFRDPDAALEWTLANGQEFPDVVAGMASTIAQFDPRKAMELSNRVPATARQRWIRNTARSYAMSDPEGALSWAREYQNSNIYDAIVAQVVEQRAEVDPASAANLAGTIQNEVYSRQAAGAVASHWARRDGSAAANWAIRLPDEQARILAVSAATQGWTRQNPEAARRWILGLEGGRMKDQALGTLLQNSARRGQVDKTALEAIENDAAREQSVINMIHRLAQQDPNQARTLIDEYVVDPEKRRQAEQMLQYATQTSFGSQAIFQIAN